MYSAKCNDNTISRRLSNPLNQNKNSTGHNCDESRLKLLWNNDKMKGSKFILKRSRKFSKCLIYTWKMNLSFCDVHTRLTFLRAAAKNRRLLQDYENSLFTEHLKTLGRGGMNNSCSNTRFKVRLSLHYRPLCLYAWLWITT